MRMFRFLVLSLLLSLSAFAAPSARAATPEARAAIDRGRSLFGFGRWSDARLEFLAARGRLAPDDDYLRQCVDYHLAACAVELGAEDAEAMLRNFAARYPASVYNNDVRFALGSYYCAQGDMKRAREELGRTDYEALDGSQRERYDIRMGYAEFAEGNYAAAYDRFSRVGASSRYADHACYYRAYIDYAEGRYGRARQAFESLARSEAYGALVPYYLLQIAFREGDYRYAVAEGGKLLPRSAEQSRREVLRVIAESHFRLEEYAEAAERLEEFAAAGGAMGRDENYLAGFSLYRTARYDEAVPYLRKAAGADDALTQNASYHLADCYLRSGDKQAAMQAFAMASNEAFDAAIAEDALFNYGKLQYELGGGRFNEAINVLNRYAARYPRSARLPEVRQLLVAAYYNSNNYDAAYEALRACPDPDADLRAALQKIAYFRGLEAYNRGDMAAARRSLTESAAVGVSPKYASLAAFWQGEIAFAEGDYATAAAKYDAYLKRAPRGEAEYAMAQYNLGYCAFERGEMAQAGRWFERFVELRPVRDRYRADAFNRLGDTHYAARRFDEAVAAYDRAIAAGGDERHYARYKRAVTLGILGRVAEKQQALRQIAAEGAGEYADDAAYELGRTYIAQERYADGAAQLERFLTDYAASPLVARACSDLGLAYLNLGDRTKSLHYYDRAVAAAPQSAEAKDAMQGIRDIYVSQGDVDAYCDYAARVGMEGDLSAVARDSLSFAAAQKLYLDKQDGAAARSLRSYVKSYPKGYYMNDALYYLSDCYLKTGDRALAIETLAALAERGNTPYAEPVLDKLSEMYFADRRYDEAASAYRRLYDAAQTAAGRERAMTGYVRATLAGGDAAKVAPMAADVAAHADAGATARRESQFAWAGQLRAQGRTDEAAAIYRELSGEVRTREGAASAYYTIEALYRAGESQRAEEAVYAFADKNSPQAYWLAKAYLLLGDIYAGRGDDFQARATYQSVADGYSPADDGIVDEAKERIGKLN